MTSSYDVIEWKNFVYIYHIQDILCRYQICKDPHLCNNIKFSLATGKNKYEHPQTGSSDLNILSIDYCTWTISLFQIIETVKYYMLKHCIGIIDIVYMVNIYALSQLWEYWVGHLIAFKWIIDQSHQTEDYIPVDIFTE